MLICDDASEAKFENEYNEIINLYKNSFENLIYLKNKEKKGACYSRNLLLKHASGKYITGLDDDDMFHPQRLSLFVNFINECDNEYSFLCSGVNFVGNKYNVDPFDFKGKIITFKDMKSKNHVGNQVFLKKDILDDVGGFDIDMPAWQDYDTWFRIIKKFGDAYKLDGMTMQLDSSEDRVRITTSSNAHKGYLKFIEKHKGELDEYSLTSLKYNDFINRKQKFSIFSEDLIGNFGLQKSLFKYKSTYDYPNLYKIYQIFFKR